MSGSIPSELGRLTNLRELYLHRNKLTGALPQSSTRLTALVVLRFYNNPGLCAPVNDAFQTWLRSIADAEGSSCAPADSAEDRAALVALYRATDGGSWTKNTNWLSDRPIREWHGVVNDANGQVTRLFLGFNQLSGLIPPELGSLASLEVLNLRNNPLSGEIPTRLGNLASLQELFLDGNQLTGEIPTELGRLANLRVLFLANNQLSSKIPPELAASPTCN